MGMWIPQYSECIQCPLETSSIFKGDVWRYLYFPLRGPLAYFALVGSGHVPVIPHVQEWLEQAWLSGFDPEGVAQLGSAYGRRVWIGTTEAAALFRSFKIRHA